MEINFLNIQFGKELGTKDSGEENRNSGQRVFVWDPGGVEVAKVSTRSPGPIRFRDHVKKT